MKKDILFVTYGGGHGQMLVPVVQALQASHESSNLNCHVLGLTTAANLFKKAGIEAFGMAALVELPKDKQALKWGKHLAEIHHASKSGVSLEESIAYLGLSFQDLVSKYGVEKAWTKVEAQGRQAFFPTMILERLFARINPDVVVATTSPRAEAAALRVAKTKNIPSVSITDLFSVLKGHRLEANAITFLNEFAKEKLLEDAAIDPDISKFYFTGNPAFDRLNPSRYRIQQDFFTQFDWSPAVNTVLHADMPAYYSPILGGAYTKTQNDVLTEMEAVYNAAMENGAIYLVRPHPSQEHGIYLEWLKGKKDAYFAAEYELHSLLAHISLLVVRTSTVGLEACYLKKKVLQLDSSFHTDLPLVDMGIAWGSESYSDLKQSMKKALTDDEEFSQIEDNFEIFIPREPAAPKIANLILAQ